MVRINKAFAVLGLGVLVLGAMSLPASAAPSLQWSEVRALRKDPPDGPKKPPKRQRLPLLDQLPSPIASAETG
jgi:hypothetical protein